MKISGIEVAGTILVDLSHTVKREVLHPYLAIVLAGSDQASISYANNNRRRAEKVGIEAALHKFTEPQEAECRQRLEQLNKDTQVSGIIIQQPMYPGWNAEGFVNGVDSKKDVDGFKPDSPYKPATALAIWEMLGAFANFEGFPDTNSFLERKKIVILGRGKTAGGPARRLLDEKGFESELIHSRTADPDEIIRRSDVVIAATGRRNIVNGSNIKEGSYVIGVGVGRDEDGVYGDLNEPEVDRKAKLYCPTIGGIGPLTIACLLRNVVNASLSRM